MDINEKLASGAEWNEQSQELTLVRKEKLPAGLSEIDITMMSGDIVIENCIDDEEPSYKATAVVRAKKEEDARKKCGSVEEAFDIKVDETSFDLEEKGDDNNFGGSGNIVVSRGSVVMVNGRLISGGGSSESNTSIKTKVVLRIRPEQAKNFNLANSSGDVDVAKVEGRGKIRTASGDVEVRSVKGQLNANTASGGISVGSVEGVGNFNTASGGVRIAEASGELSVKTASGSVSIENTKLTKDASIQTASGKVSVRVGDESLGVRINTTMGKFRSSEGFVVDKDSTRNMGADVRGHFGDNPRDAAELDISTSSGSIELRKNN